MHFKIEWEYHTTTFEKMGELLCPSPHSFTKSGDQLFQHVQTKRNVVVNHLLTHVPSTMLNNVDGGKEEMSTM
jgi:hypothetical protein